jgi:hypothetical protein
MQNADTRREEKRRKDSYLTQKRRYRRVVHGWCTSAIGLVTMKEAEALSIACRKPNIGLLDLNFHLLRSRDLQVGINEQIRHFHPCLGRTKIRSKLTFTLTHTMPL